LASAAWALDTDGELAALGAAALPVADFFAGAFFCGAFFAAVRLAGAFFRAGVAFFLLVAIASLFEWVVR
jgi:hypothetical protein